MIKQRIDSMFGVSLPKEWRRLLGTEYEHAHQILIEADAIRQQNPSYWLATIDSFNDLTVRQFIKFLSGKVLPGGTQKLVGGDGKLVKYGALIQASGPFGTAYPSECKSLSTVHDRRNKLPGSHPYDQKGGAKNKWLKHKECPALNRDCKMAISGFIQSVAANP